MPDPRAYGQWLSALILTQNSLCNVMGNIAAVKDEVESIVMIKAVLDKHYPSGL